MAIRITEPRKRERAEEAYTALSMAMLKGDLGEIDQAWRALDELVGSGL